MITHCPISNLKITRKKEWVFSVKGKQYQLEIATIGTNIYLIKNSGFATLEIAQEVWPKMFKIIDSEITDQKFFLLHDYSNYKGASSKVRKNYIDWIRQNRNRILGIHVFNPNPFTKVLLSAGKLLLKDFSETYIHDSYEKAIKSILQKQRELGLLTKLNIQTPTQINDTLWEKGFVFPQKNKTYKVTGKWVHSYKKVEIVSFLINDNIFIRKYYGELDETITHFSEQSFNDILTETNITHYHFYAQFNSNVKIFVKYRKHGVAWFNKNYKNILTGGFFNLSFINRVAIQLAKTFMYHKDFKKRIFILENMEDLFDRIENHTLKTNSRNAFEAKLKTLNKEELYNTALKLHNEKYQILENQTEEIKRLFNKLGTISWDEETQPNEEELDKRKSPFSDLNNAVLLIQKDIQEILQRRDSLIKKVEESDRLKSAFLANMSHEIRTPLNSILGFSNIIFEEDLDTETLKKYASIIVGNGNNLLNLINDIIDISKIESNLIDIRKEAFNIFELINSSFLLFSNVNTKENLKLLLDNQLEPETIIESDNLRIQQIINNLVNNAIKFTSEGHVKLSANINNKILSIVVEDTGIGIDENKQKLIFERFRQENENTDRDYGGSGLGLAISKSLSHLLGGDILLKSEKDKGSTFEFRLPL